MRVRVKICGITTPEDGVMAAEAGADAIGFVFWPRSRRHVDAHQAREIGRAVSPLVLRVGVFVDASLEELARTADAAALDVLQLHGDEPPEIFDSLSRRGLKAMRVGAGFEGELALRYEGRASGLLLDAQDDRAPGGTGMTFDWAAARDLRPRVSYLVLAGGLTAENVGQAISVVRPDAVDVSSGVESAPGRKDADKVRAFIEAVRRAA
jgi:phosphoribosylanthranilate isomerase